MELSEVQKKKLTCFEGTLRACHQDFVKETAIAVAHQKTLPADNDCFHHSWLLKAFAVLCVYAYYLEISPDEKHLGHMRQLVAKCIEDYMMDRTNPCLFKTCRLVEVGTISLVSFVF